VCYWLVVWLAGWLVAITSERLPFHCVIQHSDLYVVCFPFLYSPAFFSLFHVDISGSTVAVSSNVMLCFASYRHLPASFSSSPSFPFGPTLWVVSLLVVNPFLLMALSSLFHVSVSVSLLHCQSVLTIVVRLYIDWKSISPAHHHILLFLYVGLDCFYY